MTIESNKHNHKTEKQLIQDFWTRLASYDQLGIINDDLIFKTPGKGSIITENQIIKTTL